MRRSRSAWLYGRPSQEQTPIRTIATIMMPLVFLLICPAIDMMGSRASYGELRMLGGLLVLTSAAGLWQLLHPATGFFAANGLAAMVALMSLALAVSGVEFGWMLGCVIAMLLLFVGQWSVYRVTPQLWPYCRECELALGRWELADALDPLGIAREPASLLPALPEGAEPPYARLAPSSWIRDRTPLLCASGLLVLTAALALLVVPQVGMPVRIFRAASTGRPVIVDEDAWRMADEDAAGTQDLSRKLLAYRRYLSAHPDGRYAGEAADAAWRATERTIGATRDPRAALATYVQYTTALPTDAHAPEVEERAWQTANQVADESPRLKGKLRACRAYLAMPGGGRYASEAASSAWQTTVSEVDAETSLGGKLSAVARYLEVFPQGAHVQEAQDRAWAITKQAVADAQDLRQKLVAYETYLSAVPDAAEAKVATKAAWDAAVSVARSSRDGGARKGAYDAYAATIPVQHRTRAARDELAWQQVLAAVADARGAEEKLRPSHA